MIRDVCLLHDFSVYLTLSQFLVNLNPGAVFPHRSVQMVSWGSKVSFDSFPFISHLEENQRPISSQKTWSRKDQAFVYFSPSHHSKQGEPSGRPTVNHFSVLSRGDFPSAFDFGTSQRRVCLSSLGREWLDASETEAPDVVISQPTNDHT